MMASKGRLGYVPNVTVCWFDRSAKTRQCQDRHVIWRATAAHLYFNKVRVLVSHIGSQVLEMQSGIYIGAMPRVD